MERRRVGRAAATGQAGHRLLDLYLISQTRSFPSHARSDNPIRLFADGELVATFGSPPETGYTGVREADVDLAYDTFVGKDFTVALSGDDAWAPRSLLLLGRLWNVLGSDPDGTTYGYVRTVPLGFYFGLAYEEERWLSQDVSEGTDRWHLESISELGPSEPFDAFVFIAQTPRGSVTKNAVELSIFTNAGGKAALLYQTHLPTLGENPPGGGEQRGGVQGGNYRSYLHMMPLVGGTTCSAEDVSAIQLSVLGDDFWYPNTAGLLGLNTKGPAPSARLLGVLELGSTTGAGIAQDTLQRNEPYLPVRAAAMRLGTIGFLNLQDARGAP